MVIDPVDTALSPAAGGVFSGNIRIFFNAAEKKVVSALAFSAAWILLYNSNRSGGVSKIFAAAPALPLSFDRNRTSALAGTEKGGNDQHM